MSALSGGFCPATGRRAGRRERSPGWTGPATPTLRYGHFAIDVAADGLPAELGAGAMAVTYRAQDTVLHSTVALKVINKNVAERPEARARFLREARAAANLHHPNVASFSYYGEQDGECYYVVELVAGETLEACVRREGPLPAALVLEIGVQATRALAAAEACGVVHRDLKPANIMLTERQGEAGGNDSLTVKVIDWGLAKAVSAASADDPDRTRAGFVGTPALASPEQMDRLACRQQPARPADLRRPAAESPPGPFRGNARFAALTRRRAPGPRCAEARRESSTSCWTTFPAISSSWAAATSGWSSRKPYADSAAG